MGGEPGGSLQPGCGGSYDQETAELSSRLCAWCCQSGHVHFS